jgi:hypothetical protein
MARATAVGTVTRDLQFCARHPLDGHSLCLIENTSSSVGLSSLTLATGRPRRYATRSLDAVHGFAALELDSAARPPHVHSVSTWPTALCSEGSGMRLTSLEVAVDGARLT